MKKAKAAKEDSEEEGEEEAKMADKLSKQLALQHTCEISGHKCCWVRDNGDHIRLSKQDLSSWALWIVSEGRFIMVPSLADVTGICRAGGRRLEKHIQRCWKKSGRETKHEKNPSRRAKRASHILSHRSPIQFLDQLSLVHLVSLFLHLQRPPSLLQSSLRFQFNHRCSSIRLQLSTPTKLLPLHRLPIYSTRSGRTR